MKFEKLTPSQLVDVHVSLKGRRRIRAWGSFYNVDTDDEKPKMCCPVCGKRLRWTSELEWAKRQANLAGDVGGSSMFFRANKFSGTSPPE
jgi:hypothetical protein